MKTDADLLVPVEDVSLSFKESDFASDDFTVDGFVNRFRNIVSLEQLRDDLGVYLKLLRSALIELINKDYADFLNLSSTLIGMDKAITSLMNPLEKYRAEILDVAKVIKEVETAVDEQLKEGRRIRERRSDLERLMHIIHCVEKIEKLLKISKKDDSSGRDASLKGDVVERIASELNQLHFHVAKAQGMDLMSSIQPRIAFIANALQTNLEEDFVDSLSKKDVEAIRRCLRIHVTVDRVSHLESIFRCRVVRPYFASHVNTEVLNRPSAAETDGLAVLFASLLDIIPAKCSILQEASAGGAGLEVVSGYDFLVNAVWPEMVSFLESNAPSLFALGSPSSFHPRFLASMGFLSGFEEMCGKLESVKKLRAHPSYLVFISKFNLPVYFQMRFQEISCALEKSLCMCPLDLVSSSGSHGLKMHACDNLMACLHQCWDDGVYLPPLVHRFAKLTLQLLSRFCVWLKTVTGKQIREEPQEKSEHENEQLSRKDGLSKNYSSPDLPAHAEHAPNLPRTVTTANFSEETSTANPQENGLTVDQAVRLIADLTIIRKALPNLLGEEISPKLENLGVTTIDTIRSCFMEYEAEIAVEENRLADVVANYLASQGLLQLKFIMDIPRLFRRTNRENPAKPSTYIYSAVNPITDFRDAHKTTVSNERMHNWLLAISTILGKQLLSSTKEVLTSVQKMEESLKRLKRMKANVKTEDSPNKAGEAVAMTDDEKIRHQLWLDVHFFADHVRESFGIDNEIIIALVKLVDETKNRGGHVGGDN